MKPIEVCQDELQTALTTIRIMVERQEKAIAGLDVMIEALRELEDDNLYEALEILSEACLRFGLNCL